MNLSKTTKKIRCVKTNITNQFEPQGTRWGNGLIEEYGDKIGNKDDNTIRIGFQNINGIKGRFTSEHEKIQWRKRS